MLSHNARRQPLGLLCLFFLTATSALLYVPSVNSAGDDPLSYVLQSPTDNIFRLSIATNDIIYNPKDGLIYASRPSTAGNNGNSISRINPLTGEIAGSVYVGSEPNKLALSDDGGTLYTMLDGAFAVRRYHTSTHVPDIQFGIGREGSLYGTPYIASDIAVAPGNPGIVAVARYRLGVSPPGAGVAVFDNGVQRPQTGPGHSAGANYLAFSSSANTLYGGGIYEGLRIMTVHQDGISDISGSNQTPQGVRQLKFEGNLIFTSSGQIIDPATRTLLGTCQGVSSPAFVPVTESRRVIYAQRDGFSSQHVTVRVFDIDTFAQIGMLTVPDVGGEPTTLVRYGTNGLAMRTTNGQIYFIQTSLIPTENPLPPPTVNPPGTPTPTPTSFSRFVRQVSLPNKDFIYNRTERKFYVSVPTSGTDPRSNTITRFEPATGEIESSVAIGTNPGRLALSGDDQTLYVGIDGVNAIRKFDIGTQTPGAQFPINNSNSPQRIAFDIDVLPGSPNTVAVSYTMGGGADIYDNGAPRSQRANVSGPIAFDTPFTLYAGQSVIYNYAVGSGGLTERGYFATNGYNALDWEIKNGLFYTSSGWVTGASVIDLATGDFKGSFKGLGNEAIVTVDPPNNRAYFLTRDENNSSTWLIKAYRLDNFLPAGSLPLPGFAMAGPPRRLFRWGANGLAFSDGNPSHNNGNRIYLVQSDLVSTVGVVPTGLQLGGSAYSGSESVGNFTVTVLRSGDLSGTTTVKYATQDGTATAGQDYTATSGTLAFAPGETSKTVSVPVTNDNIFEPSESFSLVLSEPVGGTVEILNPGTAALTITDNDPLPAASSPVVTVDEPRVVGTTTTIPVTVRLSNPTSQTATFNYATANGTAIAGSDYVATSGTLTFAPLETSKTIAVEVLADDDHDEPNESFRINFSNALNVSVNNAFATVTIINYDPRTAPKVNYDFDGDKKADISVYRPSDSTWYVNQSRDGYTLRGYGEATDKLTPADFDGDGKTDLAVWRPSEGNWYIIHSTTGEFVVRNFGQNGDIPVPADFDGDGKADYGIYRPSEGIWYRLLSSNQYTVVQYGTAEDKPQIGDFDGDGKADLVVYRPSTGDWHIAPSGGGYWVSRWGIAGDIPVPGDYNGDGKTDAAVFRPSTGEWWVLFTGTNGITTVTWGVNGDIPAPGDYDGDGKTDMAVFRPSTGQWWLYRSTEGIANPSFGQNGDKPLANAYSGN